VHCSRVVASLQPGGGAGREFRGGAPKPASPRRVRRMDKGWQKRRASTLGLGDSIAPTVPALQISIESFRAVLLVGAPPRVVTSGS
jgi:hypothetical protein